MPPRRSRSARGPGSSIEPRPEGRDRRRESGTDGVPAAYLNQNRALEVLGMKRCALVAFVVAAIVALLAVPALAKGPLVPVHGRVVITGPGLHAPMHVSA